jgi:hypothetical protein
MQTKMTIQIDIETERTLQGEKHPDATAVRRLNGNGIMQLVFPGTPEDSVPIMRDLINTRADTLMDAAMTDLKADMDTIVRALDMAKDKELSAVPQVATTPVRPEEAVLVVRPA